MQNDRTDHALLLLLDLAKNMYLEKMGADFGHQCKTISAHPPFPLVDTSGLAKKRQPYIYYVKYTAKNGSHMRHATHRKCAYGAKNLQFKTDLCLGLCKI